MRAEQQHNTTYKLTPDMHDLADENCSEPTATFRFRPESWQKQNTAAS